MVWKLEVGGDGGKVDYTYTLYNPLHQTVTVESHRIRSTRHSKITVIDYLIWILSLRCMYFCCDFFSTHQMLMLARLFYATYYVLYQPPYLTVLGMLVLGYLGSDPIYTFYAM